MCSDHENVDCYLCPITCVSCTKCVHSCTCAIHVKIYASLHTADPLVNPNSVVVTIELPEFGPIIFDIPSKG
jgi:hypothetical protein